MSVLVRGMEMPECCDKCYFAQWSNIHQTAMCTRLYYNPCFEDFSREYITKRSECCPLVEVKEPHGRLGDLDKLKTAFPICENRTNIKVSAVRRAITRAETIIEAEGSE